MFPQGLLLFAFCQNETDFISSLGLKMAEPQAGKSMGAWTTQERKAFSNQKPLVGTYTNLFFYIWGIISGDCFLWKLVFSYQ